MNNSTPMLYKVDSKGVIRCWRSHYYYDDDGQVVLTNESGIEGGKLTGIPIVIKPKNVGHANETTPEEQAIKEMNSKMTKKLREGYVLDLAEFTKAGVMLAHEFGKRGKDLPEICLVQPKLVGVRCKIIREEGGVRLMSRSNKEFKPYLYELPWVMAAARRLEPGEEVDGEMYVHGLELNEITSLVMSYKIDTERLHEFCEQREDGIFIKGLKKGDITKQVYSGPISPVDVEENLEKVKGGYLLPGMNLKDLQCISTDILQFWAFDVPEQETPAEVRNIKLEQKFSGLEEHNLIALIAVEGNKSEISEINCRYVEQGFEGTILRNPAGEYVFGDRSINLQKFKEFFDAEWIIQDISIDRQGNPQFVFESSEGYEFEVRPVGSQLFRSRILRDGADLIGRPATVRYQTLYSETQKPQFARVITVRDYE